jgi:hypothetical protein
VIGRRMAFAQLHLGLLRIFSACLLELPPAA